MDLELQYRSILVNDSEINSLRIQLLKKYEICKTSKCLSFENGKEVKALEFYD